MVDVLACPRRGGRMSMIATIEARHVIPTILGHLGLPTEPRTPAPRPASPGAPLLPRQPGLRGPSGTGPSPGYARTRPAVPATPADVKVEDPRASYRDTIS